MVRVLDYVLRSHALGTVYPTPPPVGMEKDPQRAAPRCLSVFGHRVRFPTPYVFERRASQLPLRTH